jgi:hypothetical protein
MWSSLAASVVSFTNVTSVVGNSGVAVAVIVAVAVAVAVDVAVGVAVSW